MNEQFGTTKLEPIITKKESPAEIIAHVYRALQTKGYDPIAQLTGFILTGDPTYITSHDAARSLICRLERDEILEELVRFYVQNSIEG